MIYPGRRGLQSPSQLVPEARLNMAMRGWPRIDWNDPINQGLVGNWSMDGGTISGTTLADLSGNGSNGTLVNGPTLVNGVTGQALSFDGSSQSVSIVSSSVSVASVCAWVNTSILSGAYRAIWRQDSLDNGALYLDAGNKFSLRSNGHDLEWSVTPTIGVWYFLCGTNDGTTTRFYVNGLLVGTDVSSGFPLLNGSNIGRSASFGQFWDGFIETCKAWSRVLSPSEVYRSYSDTSGNLGLIVPTRRIVGANAATFQPAWAIQHNQVSGGYAT